MGITDFTPNTDFGHLEVEMGPQFCATLLFMADPLRDELFQTPDANDENKCLYVDSDRLAEPQVYAEILDLIRRIFKNQETLDSIPAQQSAQYLTTQQLDDDKVEVEEIPVIRFDTAYLTQLIKQDPDLIQLVHNIVMKCFYYDDFVDEGSNEGSI